MARREVTGRKPGVTADLIERGSGPPELDDDETEDDDADGDEPDNDQDDDEPSQHDEPAAQAVAPLPPIRGPPRRAPKKAAKKARPKPVPLDNADAFSIPDFCKSNGFSVQLFYKFEDDMPDTFSIGKRRLISREAAARWRAQREAESKAKAKTDPETEDA